MDPHRTVAEGYDRIARRYAEALVRVRTPGTYYRRFLDGCLELLPEGGRFLDLGCGAGLVTAELVARGGVIGADLSAGQLALARERAPEAAYVQADMSELRLRPGSLDGIAAFWSIIHVRRELHAALLGRLHGWLRPGGLLFGTLGSGENPQERQGDFYGAPMYWSHFDARTNRRLLRDAGFELELAETEDDMGERHLWVIARA